MTCILAIDGGNSKTLAVAGNELGQILGRGRAGCGNHQAFGLAPALEEIRTAACAALAMARVDPGDVDLGFFALAGADLQDDFDLLLPALRGLDLASRTVLDNDSIAALRAGTDAADAVVVVLGAGTVAAGQNASGKKVRLPALGWISGDWGGGGDLAREVIRAAVRAHDGRGRATTLLDGALRAFNVPDADALVRELHVNGKRYLGAADRSTFFGLVPILFDAAEAGDAVARDVIRRQACEVTVTATALLKRLDLLGVPADVVLAGSIFQSRGGLLMETVRRRLQELAPAAHVAPAEVDPVVGALLCGLSEVGLPLDATVRRTAAECYRRLEEDTT